MSTTTLRIILVAIGAVILGLLPLFFTGCAAHTSLYDATGKRIFTTQADARNITYTNGKIAFHADELIHSIPTTAQGAAARNVINGVTSTVTAAGAAIATSGVIK